MATFGERARELMAAQEVSLRELSRRTFYDKAHLSRILNGHKPASPELARRVDTALGADGTLVALAPACAGPELRLRSDVWGQNEAVELAAALATAHIDAGTAIRIAHEWMVVDPPQLTEIGAGRKIGHSMMAQTEARAAQLRRLDDHLGGGDLAELVERELAATSHLLAEATYTAAVGRRLLTVVGELAQLAGWAYFDAGRHQTAARSYLVGVQAAHAADNRPLAAQLLSLLAYQLASTGRLDDAVMLARSAYCGAKHAATPRTRAVLADRMAWAHAKAGDSGPAERALDLADLAFADADGHDDPDWAYWVDRGELDIMAGRCFTELRRPLKAEPLLAGVLANYDRAHARERSLYLTWLADTYLHAGEVDQAAETVIEAAELAKSVNSTRSHDRVREVASQFDAHHDSAAVRALTELVTTL